MDCRTGEVLAEDEMEKRIADIKRLFGAEAAEKEKDFYRTVPAQPSRTRTAKNALCPCGSGKKFKRCCMVCD